MKISSYPSGVMTGPGYEWPYGGKIPELFGMNQCNWLMWKVGKILGAFGRLSVYMDVSG